MANLKLIVKGYARNKGGYYEATSNTILIEDRSKKIIVDPGCKEKILLSGLEKAGLKPKDIDMIFLTHYHPDHVLNVRLFPNIDVLDGNTIYRGDREYSYKGRIPGTTVEVVATPGHASEHATPLVETKDGVVAIAGDLWWWEDGKQKTDMKSLLNQTDSFANDYAALLKSRKKILQLADLVIPGHGKPFQTRKSGK
ncbi:MAG: MBL fold metallo-hydrolase [Candidatus Micrarchaeia archaeon]|jgi:glyoxylase-like metal-dependent hydrolase (beta-lactamase superfamily II)